jgi:hypothetical protein
MTIKQTLTAIASGLVLLAGCSNPTGEQGFEKFLKGVDANGLPYHGNVYGRTFTDGQKPQIYRFDIMFNSDSNTHVAAKSSLSVEKRADNIDYPRVASLMVNVKMKDGAKFKFDRYFVSLTPSNTVAGVELTKDGQIVARTYWRSLQFPFDVSNLTQRAEEIALKTYEKGKQR